MKRVLVPLAPGFEDLEAVTIIDLLRRANIDVTVVGLGEGVVTGSRGTNILPDFSLDDVADLAFDMIVLPGGQPGADNLENDSRILNLLNQINRDGGYTAAICAAPKVLASAGLLENRSMTSYPGVLAGATIPGMENTGDAVVTDGPVVTSRGPGTAIPFSLELIELLVGEGVRNQVEEGLQI
jgi:4-methyl-5(b-hydroxyethyl)-thiazole monophosphate biosynthesis